jgi:hypothetical protein
VSSQCESASNILIVSEYYHDTVDDIVYSYDHEYYCADDVLNDVCRTLDLLHLVAVDELESLLMLYVDAAASTEASPKCQLHLKKSGKESKP